jgi:hypothetical protein
MAGRGVNRTTVRRRRPFLVPLIGPKAFQCCVRTQYYVKYLALPCILGVAAAIAAALTQSRIQILLAGVWGVCVLYCALGLPLLLTWTRSSSRLASAKLSADLGYRIRVHGAGGSLDIEAWKRTIDNAMERHRRANSGH